MDSTDSGRSALLSSSNNGAGVAGATSTAFGTVYSITLDSSYADTEADPCAEEEVVVVEPEAAMALVAAGTAMFAALLY